MTRRSLLPLAVVSTYPPRHCGIANFTNELSEAIRTADPAIHISGIAIDDGVARVAYGPHIQYRIRQGDPDSYRQAAEYVNSAPIRMVHMQHEFGLYGVWSDHYEDHLEPFLAMLHKPLVTVLHTVIPNPSPSIRAVVHRIVATSRYLIVMTAGARRQLQRWYGVDGDNVRIVPHGVALVPRQGQAPSRARLSLDGRRIILTFGFLHPRKGIEEMIRAMAYVVAEHPEVLYLIVGAPAPDASRHRGEIYRSELGRLVGACGLADHVTFVDEYVETERLLEYVLAADVCVTPYRAVDQVTSGVLSFALGAGRAIVSTRYLHAEEALADGRGLLIDAHDHVALARAVLQIINDEELRTSLEDRIHQYARNITWEHVGQATARLLRASAFGG